MFAIDAGIDLGTASIVIYISGKGIALKEPTVVTVDRNTDEIQAVGEDAKAMMGRTPGHIEALRPVRQGVIADSDLTADMIRIFIRKALGKRTLRKPRICVCVPMGSTELERKAVEDAAYKAGAREVNTIEVPIAAALGAGIDIDRPRGNMVVDIGGGITDVAVISMGGTVTGTSVKVAGDDFDREIVRYMKKNHNILVGEPTAEEMKIAIGCASPRAELKLMDVSGRSLETGLPVTVTVTSDEMLDALREASMAIVESIRGVLERTPPELSADVRERGIVMTGGGALLSGLDHLIEEELGVNTMIAEDPLHCVAAGTGRFLERLHGTGSK